MNPPHIHRVSIVIPVYAGESTLPSLVAEIAPLPGPNPCGPAGKAPASQRQPA